jgi:hypothetical protein
MVFFGRSKVAFPLPLPPVYRRSICLSIGAGLRGGVVHRLLGDPADSNRSEWSGRDELPKFTHMRRSVIDIIGNRAMICVFNGSGASFWRHS